MSRSEGRLEQSGDTYLPTAIWLCDTCGFTRYEPATDARWLPFEEQPAELDPARLAA